MKKAASVVLLFLFSFCLIQLGMAQPLVLVVDSTEGPGVNLTDGKVNTHRNVLIGTFSDWPSLNMAIPDSIPGVYSFYILHKDELYILQRKEESSIMKMYAIAPELRKAQIVDYSMSHSMDYYAKDFDSKITVVSLKDNSSKEYRIAEGRILVEFWPRAPIGRDMYVFMDDLQVFTTADRNAQSDTVYSHTDYKTNAYLNLITFKEKLPPSFKAELKIRLLASMLARVVPKWSIPSDSLTGRQKKAKEMNEKVRKLLELSPENSIAYTLSQEYINDAIQTYFTSNFDFSGHIEPFDTVTAIAQHFVAICRIRKEEIAYLERDKVAEFLVKCFSTIDKIEEDIPRNFIQEKYKKVWRMHLSHGNPKIDFSTDFSEHMSYGNRAYYYSFSNTLYIGVSKDKTLEEFFEDYIAELSHAEQWRRYPKSLLSSRRDNEWNYLDSVARARYKDMYWKCDYSELKDELFYSKTDPIKGWLTIEREAHSQFEPILWKELNTENYWK